jgi:hypothetical protein
VICSAGTRAEEEEATVSVLCASLALESVANAKRGVCDRTRSDLSSAPNDEMKQKILRRGHSRKEADNVLCSADEA